MRRRQVLAGLASLPALPRASHAKLPRPFRMGTTLWPPDISLRGLAQVQAFVARDCDMVAPMILGGVPWVAAASGVAFSARLQRELAYRPPSGQKMLLSLGALDTLRQRMAPLYAETDNQPLPDEWRDLAFDDPKVIAAYIAFVLRAVGITRPDWLCIGVEVNTLLHQSPDLWPAYARLHRETYLAVKAAHPGLPLLFSIAAQHFQGQVAGADAASQWQAMAELAAFADMIGFSVYPHTVPDLPHPLPDDFYAVFARFGAQVGLPVAITESGSSSEKVRFLFSSLPGSPEMQAHHLDRLLQAAEAGRFAFVVNWTSHDYPLLMEKIPRDTRSLASIWTYSGLVGPDGEDKAVTAVWRAALARPFG